MDDAIKEGVVETCNCGKSGICGWHLLDKPCVIYGSEEVAHLWGCINKWAAMLAHDGEDADLAPPDWLVNAINAATAPPKREWVGLENDDFNVKQVGEFDVVKFARYIEAILKDKNT